MSGSDLSDDEVVVRALTNKLYDEKRQRYSASVFRGERISVSRLSVLNFEELNKIFCADLHKPPSSELWGYVKISIGDLKKFGANFQSNGVSDPRQITVVPKPIVDEHGAADNSAHAEIMETLPRKLALDILAALEIHQLNC